MRDFKLIYTPWHMFKFFFTASLDYPIESRIYIQSEITGKPVGEGEQHMFRIIHLVEDKPYGMPGEWCMSTEQLRKSLLEHTRLSHATINELVKTTNQTENSQ